MMEGRRSEKIVVVVDATKEVANCSPLAWTLSNNIAHQGDYLTLLGVLHKIPNPMGYKMLANSSMFNGTNRLMLEEEAIKKIDEFEEKLRFWSDTYDKKGVYMDIKITCGTPIKAVVLKEARNLQATIAILDKHLKKDKKFYRDQLPCNVLLLHRGNKVQCLRDLDGPCKSSKFSTTYNVREGNTNTSGNFVVNAWDCQQIEGNINDDGVPLRQQNAYANDRKAIEILDGSEDIIGQGILSASVSSSSLGEISSEEDSLIHTAVLNSPFNIIETWSSSESSCTGNSPVQSCFSGLLEEWEKETETETGTVMTISTRSTYSPLSTRGDLKDPNSLLQEVDTPLTDKCRGSFPVSVMPRKPIPANLIELFKDEDNFNENSLETPIVQPYWLLRDPDTITGWKEPSHLKTAHHLSVIDKGSKDNFKALEITHKDHLRNTFSEKSLCSKCKQKSPSISKPSRLFTLNELTQATKCFSPEHRMAKGGFGSVYKGVLEDGQRVSVKRLKANTWQGDEPFLAEVNILKYARHCNLVTLLGHCIDNGGCALVYEYVCNGSLDQHLSGDASSVLQWSDRLKIALGVARALRYLHEECRIGCIVHCDLRPSNIMLTHDFTPMVGEFGLARILPSGDNPNINTGHSSGTLGCFAPEYAEFYEITTKTDVYAFGVVLLQLISGRKAMNTSQVKGEQLLLEWAKAKLERSEVCEVLDPRIGDIYNTYELRRMACVALLCIEKDPLKRPKMNQVVHLLEGETECMRDISPNIPWSLVNEINHINCVYMIQEIQESGQVLQHNDKMHHNICSSLGNKGSTLD